MSIITLFDTQELTLIEINAKIELKAIIAKRETTWSDNLDLDGGPFPIANTSRYTSYESDTVELQLTGQRNNLNYVLGYYSLKDEAYTSNPQSFFGGGQVFAQNYSGDGDSEAFYGQFELAVSDILLTPIPFSSKLFISFVYLLSLSFTGAFLYS